MIVAIGDRSSAFRWWRREVVSQQDLRRDQKQEGQKADLATRSQKWRQFAERHVCGFGARRSPPRSGVAFDLP